MMNKGLIVIRTENNSSLKISYKGSSELFNPKWNIKIYSTGTVVCTDFVSLKKYNMGQLKPPDPSLELVKIDDSGWGFPLCGVLVGLHVEGEKRVHTGEIGVEYFKPDIFERKEYLKEYSRVGLDILIKIIKAKPETHRIEICNGFINSALLYTLRERGFDVRLVEIKGLLQDKLEDLFKKYVLKKTGVDLAYDPKEISIGEIVTSFDRAREWGEKFRPDLLKSGWKKMRH